MIFADILLGLLLKVSIYTFIVSPGVSDDVLTSSPNIAPPAMAAGFPAETLEDSSSAEVVVENATTNNSPKTGDVPAVPFYSQFSDINDPYWQGRGCGVAGIAMLIDFYKQEGVSVDKLLKQGLDSGYFLSGIGWTHAGLANLAKNHGLSGSSHDFSHLNNAEAFAHLKDILEEGPVMASVYYTFDITSPIPHLAVINGMDGDLVYYNDPAMSSGGKSLHVDDFIKAWKKRIIVVRAQDSN